MRYLIILSLLCIAGCASTSKIAGDYEQILSKTLKPESDLALVYSFRAGVTFGPNIAGPLPITLIGESIGNLWQEQYLYYYSHPFTLILKAQNGESKQYSIKSGTTYYFLLDYQFPQGNHYWKQLNNIEGRELLKKYKLSGEFKKLAFNYGKPTSSLMPTENNRLISQQLYETASNKETSLNYSDKTKKGVIVYKTSILNRQQAFSIIEDVCNTKNVAIRSGSIKHASGAVYKVFDEKYLNFSYQIKFQCLY